MVRLAETDEGSGRSLDEAKYRLRWPPRRFDRELKSQILTGERLLRDVWKPYADSRAHVLVKAYDRWHERNRAMLEEAFRRIDVLYQYIAPTANFDEESLFDVENDNPLGTLDRLLSTRVARLRSIQECTRST